MTVEEIEVMSNDDLLESVIDGAGGDDYDGCFTDAGLREFNLMKAELESRLLKIGFLEG